MKNFKQFIKDTYGVSTILSDGKTNVKTAKNDLKTFIFYGSPGAQNSQGVNLCPKASPGCLEGCLFTAGMGVFKTVQDSRIRKVDFYLKDKASFLKLLAAEIRTKISTAQKKGYDVAFRLNGTTDVDFVYQLKKYENLDLIGMDNVVLYDYTKTLGKALKYKDSDNYTHTFSRSENNDDDVDKAIASGLNVAAVFANDLPTTWRGIPVIDGDKADDLMTKYKGVIIGLRAKGKAKKDRSGFVIQRY
jgi:hypothetical protein